MKRNRKAIFSSNKKQGSEDVIMDFFSNGNHKSVVMFVLAFGVLANRVLTYAEQISQTTRMTVDTNKAAKDSQKRLTS